MPLKGPSAPQAVKAAISAFQSAPGYEVKPPSETETSFIFNWGVRLEHQDDEKTYIAWLCLASDTCRQSRKNIFILSGGRTSKAVKHLREEHSVISNKTSTEFDRQQKRLDLIEQLRASPLYRNNPRRLNLLIETTRIINHNLPLRVGEYEESKLKEALACREEMQTTINAKLITHSVIELYASTKREVISFLRDNQLSDCASLTIMTDFWTCKTTSFKYLGLRLYLIDNQFRFRSVLLGTRRFNPSFGERDGGISGPFSAWLNHMMEDFNIQPSKIFGATSDSGSDIKAMMTTRMGLRWEWCIAHLAHAASKAACGLEPDMSASTNPEMTAMILRLRKTIFQVRSVEKVGDLFAQLCKSRTDTPTIRLLGYDSSRFLSASTSIRRVLDKWQALVDWYEARRIKALRERTVPPSFPLAGDKVELIQLLSLLSPISSLLRQCQKEAANQVAVLLKLYKIRLHTLHLSEPLEHYLSTREVPLHIPAEILTPLITTTRRRLRDAFDKRFFERYTDTQTMMSSAFLFEMQQRLHPMFKWPEQSLHRIIRLCCRDKSLSMEVSRRQVTRVSELISTKLREVMASVAQRETEDAAMIEQDMGYHFDELLDEFARPVAPVQIRDQTPNRISTELDKWMSDTRTLQIPADQTEPETVLQFWRRMEELGEYKILPRAARVLFAIPASAAQIERDFSVSGQMVTAQRTSLSPKNVDMCIFLNRNQAFVDLEQCEEIDKADAHLHTPPTISFAVEAVTDFFDDLDDMDVDTFSTSTMPDDGDESMH